MIKIFSYGGGVQSTAALILAVQRVLDYRIFVFSNTGDDSENPSTLKYVREIAMPFANANGIRFEEVQRRKKSGEIETLYSRLSSTPKSISIPARLGDTGAPGFRACTIDFKIKVIDKWCRKNGFKKFILGFGISVDEFHRMRTSEFFKENGVEKSRQYPLVDLRLSRTDCEDIIRRSGLPMPEKSACYFCPFHTHAYWVHLKKEKPLLFQKAVEIEGKLQSKRPGQKLFLHSSLLPLEKAVHTTQKDIFDTCESGYCLT